ncbi:hypothetical protein GCM10010403_08550 [Glycomyces rutgersensis]|uniref:Nucleotidyl transferase AbiEii toxin, Type IV TA system n=1 Tax=Glycomyces rutgersensis TaxID=58115 RepID=A0ABN3F874_9ACTN
MNPVRSETYEGSELIELLRQHVPLDFDPEEFVVAGSARLWVEGITPRLSDLDLLVRPRSETWRRAMELAFEHALVFDAAPLRTSAYTGDKIARLYGGVVEVCQTWLLPGSDTSELLERAEEIDGLKYLSVEQVVAYKRMLNRDKDKADLHAVFEHAESGNVAPRVGGMSAMLLCTNVIDGGCHGNPTTRDHQGRPRRGLPATRSCPRQRVPRRYEGRAAGSGGHSDHGAAARRAVVNRARQCFQRLRMGGRWVHARGHRLPRRRGVAATDRPHRYPVGRPPLP